MPSSTRNEENFLKIQWRWGEGLGILYSCVNDFFDLCMSLLKHQFYLIVDICINPFSQILNYELYIKTYPISVVDIVWGKDNKTLLII